MTDDQLVKLVERIAEDLRLGSSRAPVDVSPKLFIVSQGEGERPTVDLWSDIPSPLMPTIRDCGNALIGLGLAMRDAKRSIAGGVLLFVQDGWVMLYGKTSEGATFRAGSYVGELLPGNRATVSEGFKYTPLSRRPLDDGDPLDVLFAVKEMRKDFVDAVNERAGELQPDDLVAQSKPKVQRYKPINWGDL